MYVHVYVSICCVSLVCACLNFYAHHSHVLLSLHIGLYVHMCLCIHVCTCICVNLCLSVCVFLSVYVCSYMLAYVSVHQFAGCSSGLCFVPHMNMPTAFGGSAAHSPFPFSHGSPCSTSGCFDAMTLQCTLPFTPQSVCPQAQGLIQMFG